MWVATRSRNQRSCDTTTAQPAKFPSASSSARIEFTSRSFVGSSSRIRFAPRRRSRARCTRFRSPPERTPTFFCWSAPVKPNCAQYARAFISRPPSRRISSPPLIAVKIVSPSGRRVARLVDVGDLDGLPDPELAGVGLLLADDQPEERRLARPVRTDDADDAARRQGEGDVLEEQVVAVGLGEPLGLDDEGPEPGPGRDQDLELPLLLGRALLQHGLVGADARLGLGLAGTGRLPDPLELAGHRLLAAVLGPLLDRLPALLLLEPRGIVPLPGDAVAPVELEDPLGDVVEKVPVVGDGDDGPLVAGQVLLEPLDALGVEVVRRFVQEENRGLLEEEPGERDPAALASGQTVDQLVARRAPEGLHRHLDLGGDVPGAQGVDLLLELALPLQDPGLGRLVRGRSELVPGGVVGGGQVGQVPDALLDAGPDGLAGL